MNVIVASHERSGTHFLINTLALNFGFSQKWIDSDITSGADFYLASHFRTYLTCLEHTSKGRIVKEHHHPAFFEPLFDELREKFIDFVDVLNEVSERSNLSSDKDVLRLYEIWIRTGSKRSGAQLRKLGIEPVNSGKAEFRH